MPYLKEFIKKKLKIAKLYDQAFKKISIFKTMPRGKMSKVFVGYTH